MKWHKTLLVSSILMIIEACLYIAYFVIICFDTWGNDWFEVTLVFFSVPLLVMLYMVIVSVLGIIFRKRQEKMHVLFNMGISLSVALTLLFVVGMGFLGIYIFVILPFITAPIFYTISAYKLKSTPENKDGDVT